MSQARKWKTFSPTVPERATARFRGETSAGEEDIANLLQDSNFDVAEGVRLLLRLRVSLNGKVDEFIRRLDHLTEWLKNVDEALIDFEVRLGEVEAKVGGDVVGVGHSGDMDKIFTKLSFFERELDAMDNQRRMNNVVIHGLEERKEESSLEIFDTVSSFAVNTLNLSALHFVNVHRIGKRIGDKPRPVICQFGSFSDKLKFKKAVFENRNLNVAVYDDFSKRLRDIRYNLRIFGKKKREEGARNVRLSYDKLLVDGVRYKYDEVSAKVVPIS
ncbi:uncharacterized protein LOC111622354 [Centruroides sculpturatus]|uniref:uncharacterized protein LOC111622354 n=1 Tax=Centruroides sculpturatus TaxID=218467 RepID=UPI000C6E232C|nr:uncharacterized protein LOC111622354 [Centruroides sculpturatus]